MSLLPYLSISQTGSILSFQYAYTPYSQTNSFSQLIADYTDAPEKLADFIAFTPGEAGMEAAIAARQRFPVNRQLLTSTLIKQYAGLEVTEAVSLNISSLANENTYTVTTAHQPNLLTGYLYFVYKILHAIGMAQRLNELHPGKHFVPVYYIGSEDNDLDELGTFRFRGEKYVWDGGGQSGAVGRMSTKSLKPLLQQLFRYFGPPGANADWLRDTLEKAYLGQPDITAATRHLVNALFGHYGLVVLDPDDRELKRSFIPVMEDELLNSNARPIIAEHTSLLEKNYKSQIYVRDINLFYLRDQLRERIERSGDKWLVLNTGISFTKEEILAELHEAPERFSPNVALRGLYQETILPDVAFVGGGAEIAYWMQLKTIFAHYNTFFPTLVVRQSAMWVSREAARLQQLAGLSVEDLFLPDEQLALEHLKTHGTNDWKTDVERQEIERIAEQLYSRATSIDTTLGPATNAALAKIRHQLTILEKKMLRAEKRKAGTHLARIEKVRAMLFPGGKLQERTDNFMEYYLEYGPDFFTCILNGIKPCNESFLTVTCY